MYRVAVLPFLMLLGACSQQPDSSEMLEPALAAVYESSCAPCHAGGLGGAPKTGDREEWGRRTSKSLAQVYKNAIEGFEGSAGVMPAKGARPDVSDDDVKVLVDFMLEVSR